MEKFRFSKFKTNKKHVKLSISWLFYKYTSSSCAKAKAKEFEGIEWPTQLGVVINTGQGRVRVGKCLHARAGSTAEWNTRDKLQCGIPHLPLVGIPHLPLVSKWQRHQRTPPTLLSANYPPLGSLSIRLIQINIRVTVSRIQRHTASPMIWQSNFKVVLPKN